MEARAHLTNARIAPRKVQIVLDLIRGKDVETAMAIMNNTPKSACEYLEKLLKSAIANAENNYGLNKENLIVSECFVCPGPIMKRIIFCLLSVILLFPLFSPFIDSTCRLLLPL